MLTSAMIATALILLLLLFSRYYSRMRGRTGGAYAASRRPLGGAEAQGAVTQLRRGELDGLRGLLDPPRGADDRDFYCDLLAPRAPDLLLGRWVRAEPASATAQLCKGRALIERAWEVRGHLATDPVSERGRRLMGRRLRAAQEHLLAAARLDPADPTPWAHLIAVAKGLGQDEARARGYFDEATARCPDHHWAHKNLLSFLCQKWRGSHDKMFQLARQAAASAPEGGDLNTLVMDAHIERWTHFSPGLDPAGQGAAERYLRDLAVREECLAAHRRGLGSPDLVPRRSTIYARNSAALWFFLTRDKKRLVGEVAQIGSAYSRLPWAYWDAPEKAFAEATRYAYGWRRR